MGEENILTFIFLKEEVSMMFESHSLGHFSPGFPSSQTARLFDCWLQGAAAAESEVEGLRDNPPRSTYSPNRR